MTNLVVDSGEGQHSSSVSFARFLMKYIMRFAFKLSHYTEQLS